MKVGFTGTRKGMTDAQMASVKNVMQLPILKGTFQHGDCEGADAQAFKMADELGYHTIAHPGPGYLRANTASKEIRESKLFLVRNKDIVNETDMLIAAPKSDKNTGGGTWSTIRYAKSVGKKIYIVHPDGHGKYVFSKDAEL